MTGHKTANNGKGHGTVPGTKLHQGLVKCIDAGFYPLATGSPSSKTLSFLNALRMIEGIRTSKDPDDLLQKVRTYGTLPEVTCNWLVGALEMYASLAGLVLATNPDIEALALPNGDPLQVVTGTLVAFPVAYGTAPETIMCRGNSPLAIYYGVKARQYDTLGNLRLKALVLDGFEFEERKKDGTTEVEFRPLPGKPVIIARDFPQASGGLCTPTEETRVLGKPGRPKSVRRSSDATIAPIARILCHEQDADVLHIRPSVLDHKQAILVKLILPELAAAEKRTSVRSTPPPGQNSFDSFQRAAAYRELAMVLRGGAGSGFGGMLLGSASMTRPGILQLRTSDGVRVATFDISSERDRIDFLTGVGGNGVRISQSRALLLQEIRSALAVGGPLGLDPMAFMALANRICDLLLL